MKHRLTMKKETNITVEEASWNYNTLRCIQKQRAEAPAVSDRFCSLFLPF